jgi:hypothetical protein
MPSLIGNKPNQVPTNGDLGTAAFQDAEDFKAGNLGFDRLRGDFSNATVSLRSAIQTYTVNGNTVVPVIPNGTATSALLEVYNSSDVDNAAYLQLRITDTLAQLNAAQRGTGSSLPLDFVVGGASRFWIKTSGGIRYVPLSSAPASPEAGEVYYDSGTNKLRCYNGTTWNDLF